MVKSESPKIRLIVFDLDGTLVDAYKAVSRSLNLALKKVGLPPLSDDIIQRRVGWGEKVLVKSFVPANLLEKTLSIYRHDHKQTLKKGTRFLPGAKRLITHLRKKGYILAIASNRPTLFTKIILKVLKVDQDFSYVLCADKVKRPKPAADVLLGILKKSRFRADEALYVGDMVIDVQTGRKAKIKTVAVTTGSSTRKELKDSKPHAIVASIFEVSEILSKNRL